MSSLDNVRPLRPVATESIGVADVVALHDAPPTFVVTGGPGTGLPEGQYLIRALDRAVVLSHRDTPGDTWSRPVEAERS